MRSNQGSRIEAFSDAVFGFTLTLLVVSLEVLADFAGLRATLQGFPAFVATFTIICWVCYGYFAGVRRKRLEVMP